ncbi:MAG: hypothetical protein WBL93_08800 [Lutisporaceae bacterium]
MKKLLLVFDYFKETFHLNKQNKSLYTPQIALIAINVLMMLAVGIGVYRWIGMENINNISSMEYTEIFRFLFNQGLKLLAMGLAYAFISVIVEAGLLNMYKSVVTQGYTEAGAFKQGVSKYFLRLLIGKLFILVCYILAIPFYLIIGLATLSVGLTVIPLVASIFLSMWKVSLVMNDKGIFGAIGDSFSFAAKNFIPLTFLQVIHFAFTKGASTGSSNGLNVYNNMQSMQSNPALGQSAIQINMEQVVEVVKIVIAVLIPIIALATIAVSIISIIFEVFFSLALFVAYKNGFKIEEVTPQVIKTVELVEISEEANQIEEMDKDNNNKGVEQ